MQSSNPTRVAAPPGRTFLDRDGYYISDEVFRAPSLSYRIDAITSARLVRERISRGWLCMSGALALAAADMGWRVGWVPASVGLAVLATLALTRALLRRQLLQLIVQDTIKVRLLTEPRELLHAVLDALEKARRHRRDLA